MMKTQDGYLRDKEDKVLPFLAILHGIPYTVTVDAKGTHKCVPQNGGKHLTFKSRREMKDWTP